MNKNILKEIHDHVLKIATPKRAESNKWFFKTGIGQYGEGDTFIGLTVPETRQIAKSFKEIPLNIAEKLLKSEFHEERLLALFILIDKFSKGDKKLREDIFNLYFKSIKYINNWDLVDASCTKIVGEFVKEKYSLKSKNCSGVKFLVSLASDKNIFAKNKKEKLWEKRIAIVSTFAFMFKPFKNEYAPNIVFEVVKKNLNEKRGKVNNTHRKEMLGGKC